MPNCSIEFTLPQSNQSGIRMLSLPSNAKAVVIPKGAKVIRSGEGGQMKLLVPASPQKQKQGRYSILSKKVQSCN